MSSKQQHKPLHPLCQAFPAMDDEAFEQLRDDIAANGQRNPILLYEDQILDGRHRLQACLVLGIEPRFQTFTGTWEQAKAAVCSENLHRRHLTTSQRAMIAASLATLSVGRPEEIGSIDSISGKTLTGAAEETGVGRASVVRAKQVQKAGAPEVAEAVRDGKLTINKAQELISAAPTKEAQAEAVATGKVDEVIAAARPKRDSDDSPPLPRTNTHHALANRQQIDRGEDQPTPARYREGQVYIYRDGELREANAWDCVAAGFSEEELLDAMIETTDSAAIFARIMRRKAAEIDPHGEAAKPEPKSKAGKVPTAEQLQVEADEFLSGRTVHTEHLRSAVRDWAAYKQSLTGDAKVRSAESWKKALSRIERVATEKGSSHVCDLIERAIANGYQGWEHEYDKGRKPQGFAATRVYEQARKAVVKYDDINAE